MSLKSYVWDDFKEMSNAEIIKAYVEHSAQYMRAEREELFLNAQLGMYDAILENMLDGRDVIGYIQEIKTNLVNRT